MIKIVRNKNKKWYWKIVAQNGRILAHSESYSSESMAIRGAISVKNNVNEIVTADERNIWV